MIKRKIINVPKKKYKKLHYQDSEESKITWVIIVSKMDYSHTLE